VHTFCFTKLLGQKALSTCVAGFVLMLVPRCLVMQEPDNIRAWQHKFGFKQVKQNQLRQLMADVPPLNYYKESVLLSKKLPKQQQQQQRQEVQQQQEVAEQTAAEAP
jgi:hypothetical protein